MGVLDMLRQREKSLAVVGLGYVGLPLAAAYARHFDVIGFDVNKAKINKYLAGEDPTEELGSEALRQVSMEYTSDEKELEKAAFVVIAVPTPVNGDKTPDLKPVKGAAEVVGRICSLAASWFLNPLCTQV